MYDYTKKKINLFEMQIFISVNILNGKKKKKIILTNEKRIERK